MLEIFKTNVNIKHVIINFLLKQYLIKIHSFYKKKTQQKFQTYSLWHKQHLLNNYGRIIIPFNQNVMQCNHLKWAWPLNIFIPINKLSWWKYLKRIKTLSRIVKKFYKNRKQGPNEATLFCTPSDLHERVDTQIRWSYLVTLC